MGAKSSSHWPLTMTNGATALLSIFLPLILVRILTPEQIGRYQIFFLYITLSPGLFLISGLSNGLYHWGGKYPASRPQLQQSWTLLVGASLMLSVVGLSLSRWIAPLLKIPALDLRLFLSVVPFAFAALFLEDMLVARGNIWTGALYASGFNFCRAAAILAAAWWTRSVEAIFATFLAVVGLRVAVGCFLFGPTGETRFLFSREKAAEVLRYALPVSVAGLAALALSSVDQMILSWRLNAAKFAVYYIGCLSLPPLEIFQSSVNRVLIPRLTKALSANDTGEGVTLYAEGFSELFCFLLPATIGLILYAEPIIQILFTDRYMGAAHYLRVYAWLFLFWACPWDAVARARGDGHWILRTSVFFAAIVIPVTWLATGRWHAMGALVSMLSCQFLMRLYSLRYTRRSLNASYAEILPIRAALIQIGLVMIAAAISLSLRHLFVDPRLWFVLTGALFTLIYLGATYSINIWRLEAGLRPLRILELASSLSVGGLERMVLSLSKTLNKSRGVEIIVVTYDHPQGQPSLAPQFREAGITLVQWQKAPGFSMLSVLRLVQMVVFRHVRVLHAHDLGPLIYGSFAKLLSLGRLRLVLTLHTLIDLEHNPRYRFYYRVFLGFADRIIAVSPGVEQGLLNLGISQEKITVIPNGVPFSILGSPRQDSIDKLARRKALQPALPEAFYSKRWVLCLARLQPGKGQEIVLNVWSALPAATRETLVLFLVGPETQKGYTEVLVEKIRSLPDRAQILLAGSSDHPEDWIQSSDVFVSGSEHEGMPLAPLEAAGSGLPVLLTDIEGHRFLKPWALTFDAAKPEQGADRLVQILATLDGDGFQQRWQETSALREKWGVPAMSASYIRLFQHP